MDEAQRGACGCRRNACRTLIWLFPRIEVQLEYGFCELRVLVRDNESQASGNVTKWLSKMYARKTDSTALEPEKRAG